MDDKSLIYFANIMIFFTESANVEQYLHDEVIGNGRNVCFYQNRL